LPKTEAPLEVAVRKKLILIVIDGLTPSIFEAAVGDGRAPALTFLAEQGSYSRAISTFPSLTPVCLSSIATGAHPDVHRIPHLVWYDRGRARVVEYGSSFAALRAAGMARSILDTIINMNRLHLGQDAVTMYESLEDTGLTTAAINITCYRGRTRHRPTLPGLTIPAYGPKRFFFYNLFESDPTGAPLAIFGRSHGSVDGYAAAVGRWLVTRDGFDFLVYYLPDYDFASHAHGPDGAFEALARSDAAVGALLDAAGGPDDFLDRYAVVLASDHGHTHVSQHATLQEPFADEPGVLVTASNRAGMVYRVAGCRLDARGLAERLDGHEATETVLFLEGVEAVARREHEELRFARLDGEWRTTGDEDILGYPDGLTRAWAALNNPNAGEVLVSAAPGYEFADLAGRHHSGGGSHGSLRRGDSEVPMLTIGLGSQPQSIVEIAPAVLKHFGVEPPAYARSLTHAA
jgi:predicted AlkP superfamily pyrophosphatase or phosphodiesterase